LEEGVAASVRDLCRDLPEPYAPVEEGIAASVLTGGRPPSPAETVEGGIAASAQAVTAERPKTPAEVVVEGVVLKRTEEELLLL
jgi:Ni,Fe-hydrogenase III small subunit